MTPTKEDVVRAAEQAHAGHPQFRGHWRGPEWKLVLLRRAIHTKLGTAFERGDVTIAKAAEPGYLTAYSVRNEADTRIEARDAVEMIDLQKFVAVRLRLERLAIMLGARELKEACCNLVLDDGDGSHARIALAALRRIPFRHGGVEDATREIERLLEAA